MADIDENLMENLSIREGNGLQSNGIMTSNENGDNSKIDGSEHKAGDDHEDGGSGAKSIRNSRHGSSHVDQPDLCGYVKHLTSDHYYPMSAQTKGKCLIFNHKIFDAHLEMSYRNGTDKDRDNIHYYFKFKLGFDVEVFNDLKHHEILDNLRIVADEIDHSEYNCIAVFFLSHGDDDQLYSRDARFLATDVTTAFNGTNCPSLAGKPKLFFIQACRGHKLDKGVKVFTETDSGVSQMKVPETADVMVMWSTCPGYYSWRNTTNGSWFIQSLMMVLQEYAQKIDLAAMHSIVNRMMFAHFESNTSDKHMTGMKQCSMMASTCSRLVHFFPNSGMYSVMDSAAKKEKF